LALNVAGLPNLERLQKVVGFIHLDIELQEANLQLVGIHFADK
jgi:hypothetical protein